MNIANYKIKSSKELLTSQGGAILFGEFLSRIGFYKSVNKHMSAPGNHKGYKAEVYLSSIIMMLHIGGKYIEDVRLVDRDPVLKSILGLKNIPASSSVGDWLYKIGRGVGIDELRKVNNDLLDLSLSMLETDELTLDIDATGIEANKYDAKYTYKGFKGYMPIVGHIAENGMVVYDDFREGNVPPAQDNYQFINHYHIVATNMFDKNIKDILHFYQLRGEYSENNIKELKHGFKANYMPSGKLEANATFFRIQTIAYNLSILFKQLVLGPEFTKAKIDTVRLLYIKYRLNFNYR